MLCTGPSPNLAALVCNTQSDLQACLMNEKDIALQLPDDEPPTDNRCTQAPFLDLVVWFLMDSTVSLNSSIRVAKAVHRPLQISHQAVDGDTGDKYC